MQISLGHHAAKTRRVYTVQIGFISERRLRACASFGPDLSFVLNLSVATRFRKRGNEYIHLRMENRG